jgi:hypothetical protein
MSIPAQRTHLPYRRGFWLVHGHEEGEPCNLSIGGCRYERGVRLRLLALVGRKS